MSKTRAHISSSHEESLKEMQQPNSFCTQHGGQLEGIAIVVEAEMIGTFKIIYFTKYTIT